MGSVLMAELIFPVTIQNDSARTHCSNNPIHSDTLSRDCKLEAYE